MHTASGAPDGSVTIVVVDVPDGVLIEVIDDGSAGTPVVKGDLFAADGHGLYLVQQLAAQWGYLRDPAGTTVWFHLAGTAGRLAGARCRPRQSVTGARWRLPAGSWARAPRSCRAFRAGAWSA